MRWRQVLNKGTGKYELVPIDAAAQRRDIAIHGDIEPFVSPIDGSVISDRKQLREHNRKHNVVNANEFSAEFYREQAQKRADYFEGRRSKEESLKTKKMIYEIMTRAERDG